MVKPGTVLVRVAIAPLSKQLAVNEILDLLLLPKDFLMNQFDTAPAQRLTVD